MHAWLAGWLAACLSAEQARLSVCVSRPPGYAVGSCVTGDRVQLVVVVVAAVCALQVVYALRVVRSGGGAVCV